MDDVVIGDRLLVGAGEIVPVDGRLLSTATTDESALTGESLPVEQPAGDTIRSGVINAGPPLELATTASAAESTYAGVVRLVETAQASSAPFVRAADRVSGRADLDPDPSVAAIDDLAAALHTDLERGLSASEAAAILTEHGPNELRATPTTPTWRKVLAQFQDPLIYVLLGAVLVSLVAWSAEGRAGPTVDAIVIGIVVVLNAVLWMRPRGAGRTRRRCAAEDDGRDLGGHPERPASPCWSSLNSSTA